VKVLVATAAVLVPAACTDTHVLSGSFRTPEPVTIAGVPEIKERYIELVLGHYGPDVAGIAWFCTDADCSTASGPCGHLERGTWAGGTLRFSFTPPGGCNPVPETGCSVKARLTLFGDDSLEGDMFVREDQKVPVTLSRKKHSGDVVRDDLECDPEGTTK